MMTERAQKVMEAFYKEFGQTTPHTDDELAVASVLRQTINQLQQSPGVIMCADVLELCEEIENL